MVVTVRPATARVVSAGSAIPAHVKSDFFDNEDVLRRLQTSSSAEKLVCGSRPDTRSLLNGKRREFGVSVEVVLVFGLFEPGDNFVGDRRRKDFPAHLDHITA